MFVPGGLFLGGLARGAAKEGWEGLAKSIVRYDPTKEDAGY
jgi:hypothetical protein